MTWADVAAKNAPPEDEQPKPDQRLLEGHFEGETPAHHGLSDQKVVVLDRETFEHPPPAAEQVKAHSPDALNLSSESSPNDPASTEPSTSSSAPKPTDPPKGSEIKVPSAQEIGNKAGKKVDESVEKGKQAAKNAEAEVSKLGHKAKKEASELEGKAEQKAREVKGATQQLAHDASAKTKEVASDVEKKTKEVAGNIEKKTKEVAGDVEKKTKELANEAEKKTKELANEAEKKAKQFKTEASREIQHAENVIAKYYTQAKEIVLRPGALGGLMGVANVGLLSTIGYYAYTRRNVAWDRNYVGATAASVLALFGVEGVVAEQFANTPEGRDEIERAKAEGSKFYVNAREVVLRPGVAGGLLGAVNVAVLGAVGYLGYQNWDRRVWDRKIIAGIASGLVSLSAVEGLAANVWKQKREGKA